MRRCRGVSSARTTPATLTRNIGQRIKAIADGKQRDQQRRDGDGFLHRRPIRTWQPSHR